MRQPLTFVVTLLFDDRDTSALRGRIRYVAAERELPFRHADELLACLRSEAGRHAGTPGMPAPEPGPEAMPPDGA